MKCIAAFLLAVVFCYVVAEPSDAESSAEMGIADMDSDEIDDQNDNVRTSSEMRRHTRRRHKPKTTTSASTKKRTKVTKRPKSTTTEQASPFFDPVDNVENMLGLEEVQFDNSAEKSS